MRTAGAILGKSGGRRTGKYLKGSEQWGRRVGGEMFERVNVSQG